LVEWRRLQQSELRARATQRANRGAVYVLIYTPEKKRRTWAH
jgi:hypothetical protein